jgi:LuxR family maltose regulon positive regulatory protein
VAEVEAVEAACFCLALTNGSTALAGRIAEDALASSQRSGRRLAEIDARLMLARAAIARAEAPAARQAVEQALRIAAACGVVQSFISAGGDVLGLVRVVAAVPKHDSAAWASRIVAAADESLQRRSIADTLFTERERDVLRGLVKGQSTKMIARELILSPETIKHHLKAIFSKLGVRSRDAVVDEVRRRTLI